MTAAGVGKRAIPRMSEPENYDAARGGGDPHGRGAEDTALQGVGSSIDFQVQERPISAATYQK